MVWSMIALAIGFILDMLLGDPRQIPHPIVGIGKLISFLEKKLRNAFPATVRGERWAGFVLWIIVVIVSAGIPALLLWICQLITPVLRLIVESIMCWQILAARSLQQESMKVYEALRRGDVAGARYAVSMIVGRDTERLDADGIARAAIETVAENTSDGVIAPIIFLFLGGAPLGFLYKAVNTMDSMLGYTDPPYENIGMFPARADDVLNFIPARISALLLWLAAAVLKIFQGKNLLPGSWRKNYPWNLRNGWRIFLRDRYHHASPNSAQTESMCAGLLEIQLAGDAWYHGILHHKPFIGDPHRHVEENDIPRTCRLMYTSAVIALVICLLIKLFMVI